MPPWLAAAIHASISALGNKSLPVAREGNEDGRDQDRLCDDHGRRGVKQAQETKRPCPRQVQVDDKVDHDGRTPHQRVDQSDDSLAPAKPGDGKERTERQSEHAGQDDRSQADAQRQYDDLDEIWIGPADKPQGKNGSRRRLTAFRTRSRC